MQTVAGITLRLGTRNANAPIARAGPVAIGAALCSTNASGRQAVGRTPTRAPPATVTGTLSAVTTTSRWTGPGSAWTNSRQASIANVAFLAITGLWVYCLTQLSHV
nr:unnamed protein product [Callosobruchus analis]